MAFDVILPRDQQARFPARCIGCDREDVVGGVTFWSWSSSWWVLVTALAFLFSQTANARVPACRRCAWGLRFRRLAASTLCIALIAAGAWAAFKLTPTWPRFFRKVAVVAGAAVAMIPSGLLRAYRPPPFNLSVKGDETTYEFRDLAYADEFATLNKAWIEH